MNKKYIFIFVLLTILLTASVFAGQIVVVGLTNVTPSFSNNMTGAGSANYITYWLNATSVRASRFLISDINTTAELANQFYPLTGNPSGFLTSYTETDPTFALVKGGLFSNISILQNNVSRLEGSNHTTNLTAGTAYVLAYSANATSGTAYLIAVSTNASLPAIQSNLYSTKTNKTDFSSLLTNYTSTNNTAATAYLIAYSTNLSLPAIQSNLYSSKANHTDFLSLITNHSATNNTLNSLLSTAARTGTCAAGYAVQNTTTSGVQCVSVSTFGNASWNESYANTLYYPLSSNPSGYLTSYTETDPVWTAASSSYTLGTRTDSLNSTLTAQIGILNTSAQNTNTTVANLAQNASATQSALNSLITNHSSTNATAGNAWAYAFPANTTVSNQGNVIKYDYTNRQIGINGTPVAKVAIYSDVNDKAFALVRTGNVNQNLSVTMPSQTNGSGYTFTPTFYNGAAYGAGSTFHINADGKIGLGDITPSATLDISNTASNKALQIVQGDTSNWAADITTNKYGAQIQGTGSGGIALQVIPNTGAKGLIVAQTGANNAVEITQSNISGHGLYVQSSLARTDGNYYLLDVQEDSASSSANTARIDTVGTGANLLLNHNAATGYGLYTTTGTNAYTDANGLVQIRLTNSADTGRALYIPVASTDLTNEAVFIQKTGIGTGTVFKIQNDGTGDALFLDQNGNSESIYIDTEATTGAGLKIDADTLTTIGALDIRTASPVFASTNGLILSFVSNMQASGYGMTVRNDGNGKGIFVDMNGNNTGVDMSIDGTGTGLVVDGTSTNYSAIFNNGQVGINTTAPTRTLSVTGEIQAQNTYSLVEGTNVTAVNNTLGTLASFTSSISANTTALNTTVGNTNTFASAISANTTALNTTVGNTNTFASAISANTTALNTTLGNTNTVVSSVSANTTALNITLGNTNSVISSVITNHSSTNATATTLYTTAARPGTCAAGQVVGNTTTTGVECLTVGGTGTVTSVSTGMGLTGGTITTAGTVALDPESTYLKLFNTSYYSTRAKTVTRYYATTGLWRAINFSTVVFDNASMLNTADTSIITAPRNGKVNLVCSLTLLNSTVVGTQITLNNQTIIGRQTNGNANLGESSTSVSGVWDALAGDKFRCEIRILTGTQGSDIATNKTNYFAMNYVSG